jgi:hypothetical protein
VPTPICRERKSPTNGTRETAWAMSRTKAAIRVS